MTENALSAIAEDVQIVGRRSIFSDSGTPKDLLRAFVALSVVSIAVILALSGTAIHRVFKDEMVRVAESWAVYVGNTIFEQERAVLVSEDGRTATLREADFKALDARMKKFLMSFNMHKIKAFSADRTIIYSTDHSLIGS